LYIGAGSGTFRHGIVFEADALDEATDPIISIADGEFVVSRDGNLTAAGGMRVGFTGTPGAADRIEIGDASFYLELASGTTPQMLCDAGDALQYSRTDNAFVTVIGGNSCAVQSAAAFRPAANDGIALGSSAEGFADLFLASGGTVRSTTCRCSPASKRPSQIRMDVHGQRPRQRAHSAVTFADGTALVAGQLRSARRPRKINVILAAIRAHGLIAT
jgi:hypothetical protein